MNFYEVADDICNFSNPRRNKSIFPTGQYKIEQGKILFEVNIIIHRPHDNIGVGFKKEWIAVPEKYTDLIRQCLGT